MKEKRNKISVRLENAINKLANAFNKNELEAYVSCNCAVGNILNNDMEWCLLISLGEVKTKSSLIARGLLIKENDFLKRVNKAKDLIESSGYSIEQMAKIEYTFLEVMNKNYPNNTYYENQEEANYAGLIAVVDLLFSFEDLDNQKIKQEQLNKFEYEQEHN